MGIEIERKFLLRNEDWRKAVEHSVRLRQGYLSEAAHCSVRVRTSSEHAWINIKSLTIGAKRQEFEYEIPLADAHQMLDTLSQKPLIEKIRHYVRFGGHSWEIDEFEGENAGLVVAEIELRMESEAYERPPWVGDEVTQESRYYNTNLAINPYSNW